jgi:hypothetical protein
LSHLTATIRLIPFAIRKSLLALEFAHQFRSTTPDSSVFWIQASSEFQLEQDLIQLATKVNLSGFSDGRQIKLRDVTQWLESPASGTWLLVIDGIDDETTCFGSLNLQTALPQSQNGRILFTSQSRKLMHHFLNPTSLLPVDRFSYADAKTLLLTESGDLQATEVDISALLAQLDYVPVAVSQAASFIATNPTSVKGFLNTYRQSESSKIELLELIGAAAGSKHSPNVSMLVTWLMSFTRIQNENAFAADILSFVSFFGSQAIPIALLPSRGSPINLTAALGLLTSYSMISINQECDSITTHPLVRLCTREYLRSSNLFQDFYSLAYMAVYEKIPGKISGANDFAIAQPFLSHASTLLDKDTIASLTDVQLFTQSLASKLFQCLFMQGTYTFLPLSTQSSLSCKVETS